eukprot:5674768-Prorocentrum_lima.AAC.1
MPHAAGGMPRPGGPWVLPLAHIRLEVPQAQPSVTHVHAATLRLPGVLLKKEYLEPSCGT